MRLDRRQLGVGKAPIALVFLEALTRGARVGIDTLLLERRGENELESRDAAIALIGKVASHLHRVLRLNRTRAEVCQNLLRRVGLLAVRAV